MLTKEELPACPVATTVALIGRRGFVRVRKWSPEPM